jgi:hypothetical protein
MDGGRAPMRDRTPEEVAALRARDVRCVCGALMRCLLRHGFEGYRCESCFRICDLDGGRFVAV